MFSNFINKKVYDIYKIIKGKINIVLFLILIALLIWIIVSHLIGKNSSTEENIVNTESSYNPQETVIVGDDIDETVYEEEESIINTFVEYCNNGQITEAYNMLSSDCKEALYPTESIFETSYYNIIFTTKRICSLQSWINEDNYRTYKVNFTDDIMSTGSYENSDKYMDYITIVEDEDGNKLLGINKYIIKEQLDDVEKETDELYIKVESVETYLEYEEYTFLVKNKLKTTILMDTLEDVSDTIYITTVEDREKSSNNEGLNVLKLKIDPYNSERITIRFNKTSGTDDKDDKITFSNIIKDYDTYMNDKSNYEDILKIDIEL